MSAMEEGMLKGFDELKEPKGAAGEIGGDLVKFGEWTFV